MNPCLMFVFAVACLQRPLFLPRNKIRNLTFDSFQADQVGIDIADAQRPRHLSHVTTEPHHHERATCEARTASLLKTFAVVSANQRGQTCPRDWRNVFNETHILQERMPIVEVVPCQAVIVHDVIQHTFGHPRRCSSDRHIIFQLVAQQRPSMQIVVRTMMRTFLSSELTRQARNTTMPAWLSSRHHNCRNACQQTSSFYRVRPKTVSPSGSHRNVIRS